MFLRKSYILMFLTDSDETSCTTLSLYECLSLLKFHALLINFQGHFTKGLNIVLHKVYDVLTNLTHFARTRRTALIVYEYFCAYLLALITLS
jgi:hypothetical protein